MKRGETRRGGQNSWTGFIRQWTDSSCSELDSQDFSGRGAFFTTDYTDSTDGGRLRLLLFFVSPVCAGSCSPPAKHGLEARATIWEAQAEAPWGLRSAHRYKTAFDRFAKPACAVSAARGISIKEVDVWAADPDWWFDGSHSLGASHDEMASGIRSNKDHDMRGGWLSRGFVSVLPEKEIASFENIFQPSGIYLSRGGARSVPDTLLLAQEIILVRGRAPCRVSRLFWLGRTTAVCMWRMTRSGGDGRRVAGWLWLGQLRFMVIR